MAQENARNEEAVRSAAGSTVEKNCTLSRYTARLPLNWANTSTLFAGQVTIPLTTPLAAKEFGFSISSAGRGRSTPLTSQLDRGSRDQYLPYEIRAAQLFFDVVA
jgi:hypothetical protein